MIEDVIPAAATLVMGVILGYLAQRSRICFIGGLRDFILVRDRELLKGALTFFVVSWLLFSVAGAVHWVDLHAATVEAAPGAAAAPGAGSDLPLILLAAGGGIVVGLFSTLANGCPTRQHVLAAQGGRDARLYLAGFYLGIFAYYLLTRPLLSLIM